MTSVRHYSTESLEMYDQRRTFFSVHLGKLSGDEIYHITCTIEMVLSFYLAPGWIVGSCSGGKKFRIACRVQSAHLRFSFSIYC